MCRLLLGWLYLAWRNKFYELLEYKGTAADVARSVVCLFVCLAVCVFTSMSFAKTVAPIEMPFGS